MISPSSATSACVVVPVRPGWPGSFSEWESAMSFRLVTVPSFRGMVTATMPL